MRSKNFTETPRFPDSIAKDVNAAPSYMTEVVVVRHPVHPNGGIPIELQPNPPVNVTEMVRRFFEGRGKK